MNFINGSKIIFALLIVVNPVFSQVYNYTPINHFDIETNPTILASEEMNNRGQFIHQNSFSSANPFSFSSLRMSKYFESSFFGMGLTLNNTNVNDSVSYNHIAIGGGYRNVLFNAMYLKLGFTYKMIAANVPPGDFDYYSFEPENNDAKSRTKGNINFALSLSSAHDRYFVSFGILNSNFPGDQAIDGIEFPKYYVMNIGNLMTLFDKRSSEISYSAFFKSTEKNSTTFSQYIYFKFNLGLSRSSGLNYGLRLGFAENDYYHFIPFLAYYRNKFVANVSYNSYLEKVNFDSKYHSTVQLSIIYIL